MHVKNVRWVGVHTEQYDQTVAHFGEVLEMRRHFEEPATVEFETTAGDAVQVMGPGHPCFQSSVVTHRVRCRYSRWTTWPDGHLYELAAAGCMLKSREEMTGWGTITRRARP